LNAPVSKTGMGGFVHRGFESLPLRYITGFPLQAGGFRLATGAVRGELPLRLWTAQNRSFGALAGAQLARTHAVHEHYYTRVLRP
jgi:hypothetical protein